jgi:DNA mismatch endonuclease (patch repair protein)
MADKFSAEKRSDIMSRVHSENTTPEIRVRKLLHRMGYRFRLHRTDLPGKPDIILPRYNTAIFVHGCFWHGCPTCRHAKIRPATNTGYWNRKLDRTIERDKENQRKLKALGWRVLVIWECETKKSNEESLLKKIRKEIS